MRITCTTFYSIVISLCQKQQTMCSKLNAVEDPMLADRETREAFYCNGDLASIKI